MCDPNDRRNQPERASEQNAMRTRWLTLVWTFALAAFAIFWSPAASAHDAVIASNPSDGSTVSTFPERVEIEFSGEPRPSFNTIAITKADDSTLVAKGSPEVEGKNLSLAIPSDVKPAAGEYIIGFQITSSDGHATRGKLSFNYKPAHETTAGNDTTKDKVAESSSVNAAIDGDVEESTKSGESSTEGGFPMGLIVGLIGLIVIIGATLLIVKKRKN